MKQKIKIVIADDHQIFIEGIKALIKENDPVSMVGEARDGETLMQLLKIKKPDVVLMDLNMPRMNGIEATRQIKALYPLVRIIGLTMHDDTSNISDMMKAGASGYLLKTTGKQELIGAISRVNKGEKYLSNEVSTKLLESMFTEESEKVMPVQSRKVEFTKREMDIIRLIAQELTNVEIAAKLNNSPMTIITHRKNLLRKLGVKNTAGLVKYAVQNGLLE
ncbi:MAG: response regulator transcription factor [Chitinophagales bacterium]|nr:response regulator transcription factor [Chitinophagales bacterium]